jgi:hypothetical protein
VGGSRSALFEQPGSLLVEKKAEGIILPQKGFYTFRPCPVSEFQTFEGLPNHEMLWLERRERSILSSSSYRWVLSQRASCLIILPAVWTIVEVRRPPISVCQEAGLAKPRTLPLVGKVSELVLPTMEIPHTLVTHRGKAKVISFTRCDANNNTCVGFQPQTFTQAD